VLVVTSYGRPGNVRRAFAAKASGFVVKDAPPDRLADAIRRVAAGERVIDPQLAVAALEVMESPLTERELDVLRRFAEGTELAEIAQQLHLSLGTVRNYLTTIVTKLNARNRLHAVRIATDAGWL
jgi:two-component system response regulator DesR